MIKFKTVTVFTDQHGIQHFEDLEQAVNSGWEIVTSCGTMTFLLRMGNAGQI